MKTMNYRKYEAYPAVDIPERTWPDRVITQAPQWCSVDLRDGNQALSIPMGVEEKLKMFELLVSIGFKEIEVGFPSASEIEHRFVRRIIEEKRIPDDVTIQVLTQAREHLIRKTFDSLQGVGKAIVHLYNSTSRAQREDVFRMSREQIKAIAVRGTALVKLLKDENPCIHFEYSPESFTGTEPDYALEVCRAVIEDWKPDTENKIIINLPSTVEMSTPNVYADRIEWFCRNLRKSDTVIVGVHTHNDRGTAVAAAELAVMAGAQRVEGALFGNGERSGNMDIVTMALNLFSRGIDPRLDFSDMDRIIAVYRQCTRMEVPLRQPYAGELVYTAFSGSHQDAINKGIKARTESGQERWEVPYLPIDPQDVGRTYEAIIRINSQSGKGGIAYVMEKEFGIHIPKWMQPDFAAVVQEAADKSGQELSAEQMRQLFDEAYIRIEAPYKLKKCHIDSDGEDAAQTQNRKSHVAVVMGKEAAELRFEERGNGPVEAFVKGLRREGGIDFKLEEYAEHAVSHGEDSLAVSYIMIRNQSGKNFFGAGIDSNIAIASIRAIVSALNRLVIN